MKKNIIAGILIVIQVFAYLGKMSSGEPIFTTTSNLSGSEQFIVNVSYFIGYNLYIIIAIILLYIAYKEKKKAIVN